MAAALGPLRFLFFPFSFESLSCYQLGPLLPLRRSILMWLLAVNCSRIFFGGVLSLRLIPLISTV